VLEEEGSSSIVVVHPNKEAHPQYNNYKPDDDDY